MEEIWKGALQSDATCPVPAVLRAALRAASDFLAPTPQFHSISRVLRVVATPAFQLVHVQQEETHGVVPLDLCSTLHWDPSIPIFFRFSKIL